MSQESQTPPAAQITICGALNTDAIAALVQVAMTAGAALMVQPRAIVATSPGTVAAAPRAKALLPAPEPEARRPAASRPPGRPGPLPRVDVDASVADRARRALVNGPLSPKDFQRAARVSVHVARQLVTRGVVVATGVTQGRRYALPTAAKEAP